MAREKSNDPLHRLLDDFDAFEKLLDADSESSSIDVPAFTEFMLGRVIGQDEVCIDVAKQINRRMALEQRSKPVGVFLFAGPPGTGKTFLAKKMAEFLERKLLHWDMTQFMESHAVSVLFGSAPGYVGGSGKLTSDLIGYPDAIVLLDEIEKAHPDVLKRFLTGWNDGFIQDTKTGNPSSTTKAIFVLTSNAATDALDALSVQYKDDPDGLRAGSVHALKEFGFAPEVLSRIDRIFVFKRLEGKNIARVALLEIEAMIRDYGLSVAEGGISHEFLFTLLKRQTKLGAAASSRDLARFIEEMIADDLADVKKLKAKQIRLVQHGETVKAEAVL